MKIIGIIPARYSSTRFPGKPLAEICGKPMIWWVYNQVSQVQRFSDVFVAIDDERIREVCEKYKMKYVMTKMIIQNIFQEYTKFPKKLRRICMCV